MKQKYSIKADTHRALGNNVAEEFLINQPSVPPLFEIETKQHSHLSLIRLIVWIHLGQSHTLLIRKLNLTLVVNILYILQLP